MPNQRSTSQKRSVYRHPLVKGTTMALMASTASQTQANPLTHAAKHVAKTAAIPAATGALAGIVSPAVGASVDKFSSLLGPASDKHPAARQNKTKESSKKAAKALLSNSAAQSLRSRQLTNAPLAPFAAYGTAHAIIPDKVKRKEMLALGAFTAARPGGFTFDNAVRTASYVGASKVGAKAREMFTSSSSPLRKATSRTISHIANAQLGTKARKTLTSSNSHTGTTAVTGFIPPDSNKKIKEKNPNAYQEHLEQRYGKGTHAYTLGGRSYIEVPLSQGDKGRGGR